MIQEMIFAYFAYVFLDQERTNTGFVGHRNPLAT